MIKKSTVYIVILWFGVLISGIIFAEIFVRAILLRRDFSYIDITRNRSPFFQLREEYTDQFTTIHKGRREYYKRGERDAAVAFVGDSVTFGCALKDKDVFVERIQNSQQKYDVYNYGVPGYGIVEVQERISVIAGNGYKKIIYIYNFNDTYPAMTGWLSLLVDKKKRFSAIERYQGIYGYGKLYLKDYFKSFYVIKGLLQAALKRVSGKSDESLSEINVITQNQRTPRFYNDIRTLATCATYIENFTIWEQQYKNKEFLDKLTYKFIQIKNIAHQNKLQIIIIPHYDFLILENKADYLAQTLYAVLRAAEIEFLDTYPLYERHYKENDFYVEPGHLGKIGSAYLSEIIRSYLLKDDRV
jgi:hypothetical protein